MTYYDLLIKNQHQHVARLRSYQLQGDSHILDGRLEAPFHTPTL